MTSSVDRDRIVRSALVSLADDIATMAEQGLSPAEIATHFTARMTIIGVLASAPAPVDRDAV